MSWGELSCKYFQQGNCPFNPTFDTCHKKCEYYIKGVPVVENRLKQGTVKELTGKKFVNFGKLSRNQKRNMRKKHGIG